MRVDDGAIVNPSGPERRVQKARLQWQVFTHRTVKNE